MNQLQKWEIKTGVKMKNPKQKGGSFEREICKKLSEWVSNGKSDDLFWRSAMSGGRATVRKKKDKETASGQGDITAVTPAGNKLTDRFVIECKHYNNIGFSQYIYGQGSLVDIWSKLLQECGENKRPMLIVKENRKQILIGLDRPIKGIHGVVLLCFYWSGLHLSYLEDVMKIPFKEFIK